MSTLERRMGKLEQARHRGVEDLTDEQLEARIRELDADPDIQAWLADESDDDPMRLELLRLKSALGHDGRQKQ